jgi:hypothetical protein
MKKYQLGEFEEVVILTIGILNNTLSKKAMQYSKETRDELWKAIPKTVLQINMGG